MTKNQDPISKVILVQGHIRFKSCHLLINIHVYHIIKTDVNNIRMSLFLWQPDVKLQHFVL